MGKTCRDIDGDGFGNGSFSITGCTYTSIDCDDNNDEIHPLENDTSLYIDYNLTVCTATYDNASVYLDLNNKIFNLNGSTLIGQGSGTAINFSADSTEAIVKDGTINNYTYGFYGSQFFNLPPVENATVQNLTLENNTYGLYLESVMLR